MRNIIKRSSLLLAVLLLAALPATALAQNTSELSKAYYGAVFGNPKTFDAAKYTASPDELAYYKATDWDYAALQLKYSGVTDMALAEFIATTAQAPYDTANPAGWIIAAHYPQNTGNTAVDAALAQKARQYYERDLPAGAKIAAALNTEAWPAADKINDADNDFDSGKIMLYLSYITKKLQLIQNQEYTFPAANAGPIFPFITTYQITQPATNYITVIFTNWFYTGGAHDSWMAEAFTYDLKSGKQLALKDLLTGKNADKLQAYFEAKDKARRGADNFVVSMSGGKYPALDMEHMALTPEGLMIIFSPYEIGSFAEGTIVYLIDKSELKDLGVNTKYWE